MGISIVVIEYNCLEEIRRFVERTEAIIKEYDVEIIVSSNSLYTETKKAEILREFSDIRWLFNEKNGGFAYGMNCGLAVAKGEMVAICNPDVTILGGIGDAMRFMREHPEIGAIGPRVEDEKGNIQDSCRPFLTVPRFVARQVSRLRSHCDVVLEEGFDYSKPQAVPWVIGAFIIAWRSGIEKVGVLDERFFMYNEDMDWCTRFWKNGLKVFYYPELRIQYKGTRAARKKLRYAMIFLRSNLRYWFLYGFFKNRYETLIMS